MAFTKLRTPDTGELLFRFAASKLFLSLLALLMLIDSLSVSRGASPGHGATFFLAWALVTRLWLVAPSRPLLGFCLVISAACICANHGLLATVAILHSFYFYFVSGLLIVFWERIKQLLGMTG